MRRDLPGEAARETTILYPRVDTGITVNVPIHGGYRTFGSVAPQTVSGSEIAQRGERCTEPIGPYYGPALTRWGDLGFAHPFGDLRDAHSGPRPSTSHRPRPRDHRGSS